MGIQNVAALSALEFLKPPQKMVPTKNPKLLKMGLKEEMNPAYLEMIAMGTMGKPKGVGKLKTTKTKFSKGLEAEIDSYTDVISERWTAYGEKPYSKKEILQELMQDHMDNPQHPISKYKRELQDFGAKIGIWKSVSKTQLKEMVAPGKKYEFKRGDKYYVFDSWKPLMKKAQVSKSSAPAPVKFKMAEDFEYSGNWVGTVGGKEHKIWRETQTGGDTIQGWWYDEAGSFLGMTKKEAIEKLQSMAAGLGGR
jgi:hypothetical protein